MLPRVRWVVRVVYAVITHHEREVRARKRTDAQWKTPEHMVHTKRMKLALVWTAAFWREGQKTVRRVYYTVEPPRDLAIVTDASPWGAGGVLAGARGVGEAY